MHAALRSTIIRVLAHSDLAAHAVGHSVLVGRGHAVMRAVEAHVRDPVVAFDARGFLNTGSHVLGDFAEDGDFPLDNLGVGAFLHVA